MTRQCIGENQRMTKAMAVRLLALWCGWQAAAASAGYGDLPAARALVDELVEERGLDRDHLLQELIRRGVHITELDRYYQGPPPWQGYALGYSHLTSEEITRGCDALCQALKNLRVQSGL